ncbi:hypothetical protein AMTR_s00075p00192670 [Amborella trichopoda]|uniref:Uncharacterized protein n=1 Tax=Amborella trichopoda TaxID=13333 RepID=W1PC59_AMBTC|nr:hypothetical protein AMTR_s00075p00192670 [Amborella trichopoda]
MLQIPGVLRIERAKSDPHRPSALDRLCLDKILRIPKVLYLAIVGKEEDKAKLTAQSSDTLDSQKMSDKNTHSDPSLEVVTMLRWVLYGLKAHQILRNMNYESSNNEDLNDGKGMLTPFAIIEAMSSRHRQKRALVTRVD